MGTKGCGSKHVLLELVVYGVANRYEIAKDGRKQWVKGPYKVLVNSVCVPFTGSTNLARRSVR